MIAFFQRMPKYVIPSSWRAFIFMKRSGERAINLKFIHVFEVYDDVEHAFVIPVYKREYINYGEITLLPTWKIMCKVFLKNDGVKYRDQTEEH